MKILNLRHFIIDREFQKKYIFYSLFMLLFVVVSIFVVVVVWNHFRFYRGFLLQPPTGAQVLAWAQQNNVKTDSVQFAYQFLLQARPYSFYEILIYPVLAIFAINVFVIAIMALFLSYKIARPIHELKIALRRKVETGHFEKPLTVREQDPFHELTSLANLALYVAKNPDIKPYRDTGEERNLKGDL